ncbi:hypothetical protein [Comamonas sp.]|uniref:hypothetical protein n=1 Tax=Comamonas sp. TaxID=34028 RepID=UPI0026487C02|nr:hypothetical protein [Comamonas sp.]
MLIHVWLKGMPTWPLAMNLPELHGGLEASADAGNASMVERADDAFFASRTGMNGNHSQQYL